MATDISFEAARLERDGAAAEGWVYDALIAVSSLTTSVVTARRDIIGVPATSGHATIRRLAKAQMALVDVSGDILRVHGDLVQIGRETAGYDLHECPAIAGAVSGHLSAATRIPLTRDHHTAMIARSRWPFSSLHCRLSFSFASGFVG